MLQIGEATRNGDVCHGNAAVHKEVAPADLPFQIVEDSWQLLTFRLLGDTLIPPWLRKIGATTR